MIVLFTVLSKGRNKKVQIGCNDLHYTKAKHLQIVSQDDLDTNGSVLFFFFLDFFLS